MGLKSSGYRILMIEDDPGTRQFLRMVLTEQGFVTNEALTGKDGLTQAAEIQPDLILLDMCLPDMSGVTVAQHLREWTNVPVIVLSGNRKVADKVAALDAGADDYMTKPYGVEELLARIRVAQRHKEQSNRSEEVPVFTVNDLKVDLTRRQVFMADKEISLTPTEYNLLTVLVRNAGKVLPHSQLLREVWGPQYVREATYVRIYIQHLRRKIEADPSQPRYILSEPGVGYRLATT